MRMTVRMRMIPTLKTISMRTKTMKTAMTMTIMITTLLTTNIYMYIFSFLFYFIFLKNFYYQCYYLSILVDSMISSKQNLVLYLNFLSIFTFLIKFVYVVFCVLFFGGKHLFVLFSDLKAFVVL